MKYIAFLFTAFFVFTTANAAVIKAAHPLTTQTQNNNLCKSNKLQMASIQNLFNNGDGSKLSSNWRTNPKNHPGHNWVRLKLNQPDPGYERYSSSEFLVKDVDGTYISLSIFPPISASGTYVVITNSSGHAATASICK